MQVVSHVRISYSYGHVAEKHQGVIMGIILSNILRGMLSMFLNIEVPSQDPSSPGSEVEIHYSNLLVVIGEGISINEYSL